MLFAKDAYTITSTITTRGSMNSQYVEVMDLTRVASTFPQLGTPNIQRENMIMTLFDMLQTDTELVIVEGPDGIGKTTLLAQFAREYSNHTFSLFVRSSSRWAYDSGMLTRDLCDQIGWVLSKESYRTSRDLDPVQSLGARIFDLQRQANYKGAMYYFVVDGLDEIPKEDGHEREMILKLLPFGLPRFRFILSGPLECLKKRSQKIGATKAFRLPGFTFEETREFFASLIEDRATLETIHKVSKMVPGNLASVRRLLQAGTKVEKLLEEIPERLPDLFELEWRVVDAEDVLLRQALAILAFDRRRHTIATLSRLCKTDPASLERKLACCNFVERRGDGGEVDFVCEVFKRFAADRLSSLRRGTLDSIISELLNVPESADALTHLPGFLHQTERYEELLTYLSPKHIGSLIDCGNSWIPLHQKADLGVDTALRMSRDGDLLRFGLQRAMIASMESAEPWRSEIEAYVALNDFSAAYALVQRMVTKEDRLHLLSVIARAKKTKSLPIELALTEQIRQLYRQLDRNSLGDRGVEIASDLLYTDPELAVELVQECTRREGSEDRLDLALATLSFKALMEKENGLGMDSTHKTLRAKVKDPKVQKFVDTVSIFFGGYSAEGVIVEVEKWENPSDRIFALRAWTTASVKRQDAAAVVDYALNTILKTTTYAANAKVYQQLAMPLVYLPDKNQTKNIIGRLDGLKGAIESAGPTEEYVRLQATLSEAEARYDKQAALDRLLDVFFYVDALTEPSTKLASLAVIAGVLKQVDPDKQYESQSGIHSAVVDGLSSIVDEILTKTADHYEAVRPAIGALANSDTKTALNVIAKLNTAPRREAALVKFVEAVAAEPVCVASFDAIAAAYRKLTYIPMRAQATRATLQGLLNQKKELRPFIARVIALQRWVKDIPNAEEKCQALCMLLELLIEHRTSVPPSFFDSSAQEMRSAWDEVDLGWSKINSGFKIVALMAEGFPDISREFLNRTVEARNEIVLDCPDTATSYLSCVRLAIRCFRGLLKRKLYGNDDLRALHNLIDRIPAVSTRMLAWSELALKFCLENDLQGCRKIISERVRPILESDAIKDSDALWSVIVSTAPALYCAHDASARQLIDNLPQPYRDEAYAAVCSFLITKRLPTEPYDTADGPPGRVGYEDFLDVYEVLGRLEADSVVYCQLESLVDRMEKRFRAEFSKPQIADILQKLRDFVARKFPNPGYITHEGFKILAEAQIARLDRDNKSVWDDLAKRAGGIPNVADVSFVLMGIGAAMPSKEASKAILLFQEARALIPRISTLEDRFDRLETLAKQSARIDKQISKDCLRQAWNETMPLDPTELPKARRRIIDFAHRLDPEFAASLASETDDDPGREFARTQTRQRLEMLKLRETIAAGEENALSLRRPAKQEVEIARMLLSGLNSNRISPVHIDFTRPFVKKASQMNLKDAYTVLSWVIENAVRRYSDTDQANTFLRPLYEAACLSAELAFRIAVRIRSVTDLGISVARATESDRDDLIRSGERDKALALLKEWASKASGFIKITDPYFGLEELELIKLIRSVNMSSPVFILTSRKHQQDIRVMQPWDDAYQTHWRVAISDADPGEVTIVIVGKNSNGEHPIHDRWWLAENGGLRIGTSANALGVGKLSEISPIGESDAVTRLVEVGRYLAGSVRELGTERLKYLSFKL